MSPPFRPRRAAVPASASGTPPGDLAARFDALVLAQYGPLCQFAYRIVGSQAVAEDLVQDLFLAIWRRHREFDYADALPYLYRATRLDVRRGSCSY